MEEKTKLWLFNRFGSARDVFDNYREAVDKSNRTTLRVLSGMAILVGVCALIYTFFVHETVGIVFSLLLALMGIMGMRRAFGKDTTREELLHGAYWVSVFAYAFAIYATVRTHNDAFWVGIHMTICCFLLDYAWRVILVQGISWLALVICTFGFWGTIPGLSIIIYSAFLLVGIITFYTLSRAKINLIQSREETREQADTDLLTGLTIRNTAESEIMRMLEMDEEPGVMMLLDLDRFKSVNDQLGHQKGDQVLIDVAADLKKMFRSSDVLSRLGGDEFIIYMRSVPEREWAMQRAEQVVRAVRRWVGDGVTNIQISASVGVVMTSAVERSYAALYRAADIAMYYVKSQGGNKAVMYAPELTEQAHAAEEAKWERGKTRSAEDLR